MSDFDDDVDLDLALANQRAQDKTQLSSLDDALALIDKFRQPSPRTGIAFPAAPVTSPNFAIAVTASPKSPWVSLDRKTVADGLEQILRDPSKIAQSLLPLCGPASFFNVLAVRHPVAVAKAATTLFETGRCSIGNLQIAPSSRLTAKSYAAVCRDIPTSPPLQINWMLLSALGNTSNPDYVGETSSDTKAGGTAIDTLKSWFDSTGFFSTVVGDVRDSWRPGGMTQGVSEAEKLDFVVPGTDYVVGINANMVLPYTSPEFDKSLVKFINHVMVLISELVVETTGRDASFSYWSWGCNFSGVKIPLQDFVDNYFGHLRTRLAQQGTS
jgi:hypothetical protein